MGIEEERKNGSCYSNVVNRMEGAHNNISIQVEGTIKNLRREFVYMYGIDSQSSESWTRTFIDFPSTQEMKSDSKKHKTNLNGFEFSDLLKAFLEIMQ